MPINSDLKDKITQYTDKIPDEKLLHELSTSQTHSDLAPVIDQYRQQGKSAGEILDLLMAAKEQDAAPPRPTSEVVPGTMPQAAITATKSSPLRPKMAGTIQGTPEELNAAPGNARPVAHLGETSIGTNKVPEWKQRVMPQVNALPEYGEAAGTAAGMGATAMNPAAAMSIPVGAGAGRVAGKAAQSALTKLLLPESDAGIPTATSVGNEAIAGATGGMKTAIGGKLATKAVRPANTLGELMRGGSESAGRGRDVLTKKLLTPSLKDPEMARRVIQNVGKEGIDIAGGEGPAQIQNRIRALSGNVDGMIADAASAGKTVSRTDLMGPMYQIQKQFADAGLAREARQAATQIKAFEGLPDQLDPVKAQEIKKLIYNTIEEGKWTSGRVAAADKARKSFSGGIAKQLEDISPGDLKGTNQEIGRYIEMRPSVTKAAEKANESGLYQGLKNKAAQGTARGLNKLSGILDKNAPQVADNTKYIGSKYANLDRMFGTKYKTSPEANFGEVGPVPTGITSPRAELPAPAYGTNLKRLPAPPGGIQVPPTKQLGYTAQASPLPEVAEEAKNIQPLEFSEGTGQKLLTHQPTVTGTTGGTALTSSDIEAIASIAQKDPQVLQNLMKMLGMGSNVKY